MPARKKKSNTSAPVPPVTPLPSSIKTEICNLTDQLGYRAVYDPNNLAQSTLFPAQGDFLGGQNDGNTILRFVLIDPALAFSKKMQEADWKKFNDKAGRLGRESIKPLWVEIRDPGTGKKVACWELKIGGSPNRLLGAWLTLEGDEEGMQYHVLVLNTLTGKVGNKTIVPNTLSRALRFPRHTLFFSLPLQAPIAPIAAPKQVQAEAPDTPSPISPLMLQNLLAEMAAIKADVLIRTQKNLQQLQEVSTQCELQAAELAQQQRIREERGIPAAEVTLVQDVLHFVTSMESFLQAQSEETIDPQAAAKYVVLLIGVMTKKTTSAYVWMLKKAGLKSAALPAAVVKEMHRYVQAHPELWQLRNHLALAHALKHVLENGNVAVLAQGNLFGPAQAEVSAVPDEKEVVSVEEIARHFAELEASLQNKKDPLFAEKYTEIAALISAVGVEIPDTAKAQPPAEIQEAEENEEDEGSISIEEAEKLLEIPVAADIAVRHPLLQALQTQTTQLHAVSLQYEAQKEQLTQAALAAQQIQEAHTELRRSVFLFVQGMQQFLNTQPKTAWAGNAAAGVVGEVIEAILEGPAAYNHMLETRCVPAVAEEIKKYLKAHPSIWQLRGELHLHFTHALIDALYKGKVDFLKSASAEEGAEEKEEKQGACQLFQVPAVSSTFVGREAELDGIAKSLQRYRGSVIASELDGLGKTQLAARYVEKMQMHYQTVIWFHAGRAGQDTGLEYIDIQCIQLAKAWCGLHNPSIEEAIAALYAYLQNKPSLLVFDDAASHAAILPYLPPRQAAGDVHVLITSRNTDWGFLSPLILSGFSQQLASDLIRKRLPDVSESDVEDLARSFAHAPLALSYALAYNLSEEKRDIPTYLQQYAAQKQILEACNTVVTTVDPAVLVTVMLMLGPMQNTYPIAAAMLDACAYCRLENIPMEMLTTLFVAQGQEKIASQFALLKQYALLRQGAEGCVEIHRGLQEIILHPCVFPRREGVLLLHIINHMVNLISQAIQGAGADTTWQYIPHLDRALLYYQHSPLDAKGSILKMLGCYYTGQLNQPKRAYVIWKLLLDTEEKRGGEDRYSHASMLVNMGTVCYRATHFKEALTYLQSALTAIKQNADLYLDTKKQDADKYNVLQGLVNTCGALQDWNKKRIYLEQLHALREKMGCPEEEQVTIFIDLATAYRILAEEAQKKGDMPLYQEHLEKALGFISRGRTIQEKHPSSKTFIPMFTEAATIHALLYNDGQSISFLKKLLAVQETEQAHLGIATTLVRLAEVYDRIGNTLEKRGVLTRALATQETQFGADHYALAATLVQLGNTQGDFGNYGQKRAILERALSIQEAHFGSQTHYEIAATLVGLGSAYGELGELRKGLQYLKRAQHIQEKHFRTTEVPEMAMTFVCLSQIYGHLGKIEKRRSFAERALAIQEKHYHANHPQLAEALVSLGHAYHDAGDYQQAWKTILRAASIQEKYYGTEHYKTADTFAQMAGFTGAFWLPVKAIETLKKSLVVQEEHYGMQHAKIAFTLIALGKMHGLLYHSSHIESLKPKQKGERPQDVVKRVAEARTAERKALQHARKAYIRALHIQEGCIGENHFKMVAVLMGLQNVYAASKEFALQHDTLKRIRALQESHFGHNNPKTALTLALLACTYAALHQREKALTLGKRSCRILMQDPSYGLAHLLTQRCMELLTSPDYACGFSADALMPEKPKQPSVASALNTAPQTFFQAQENSPAVYTGNQNVMRHT